jgi:branched-chain amino acid transport system substrate-binding protein
MAVAPTPRRPGGLPRRTLLGAGLAGALAGVAGCARQSAASPARLPAGPDLVIGVCLELTGANAIVGSSAQRGVQVALEEINADGLRVGGKRRNVRLVLRDNRSDPDVAATAVGELISGDQVSAVIGGAVAATSAAMSPIAEKRQVPMISLAAADNIVRPVPNHRFVFKLGPDAANVADLLVARLAAGQVSSIAILAEASPHGDAGLAAVTDSAHAAGITVSRYARLPVGAPNYVTQAALVAADKPKAVVVWSQAPVALSAATSLRQIGYRGELYFDTGAAADDAVNLANSPVMSGAHVVAPEIMSADSQLANSATTYARQVFFNDFNRRYGVMTTYAIFGADALRMLGTAAERAVDPTRLRLRNGLEAAPFYLLGGAYRFSTINHGGVEPDQLTVLRLAASGWRRS